MKLFTTYSRINLLSTVVIFLLASIAFSFLLRYVVISQIDEDLRIEKNEVLSYINKFHSLPALVEVHDQYTHYQLVSKLPREYHHIHTRRIHDSIDKDDEWERTISFGAAVNDKLYLITVSKSLEGTDDLIQSIILITIATIVLILTVTFFINRLVLRRLWQPFYNTLQKVEKFKLSNNESFSFSNSRIDEFNLLNTTLSQTINKAQQDYVVLKEFTENASHEMQTPLAVIRSKLDLMIQSEDLTEPQSATLQGAYDAIKSLKKLNQSLLLLAKIENNQFAEKTLIDLDSVVKNKQKQWCEQWQNLHLQLQSTSACRINGNTELIEILLNNLFSNAIKHNIKDGFIIIELQPFQLSISNSGEAQSLDEQNIFNRFYKGNAVAGSHGLGLSIVKQICDVSGYKYRYYFALPNVHSFIISWV